MKLDSKTKRTIDGLTYDQMTRLSDYAIVGHPYFIGKVGKYFQKVMRQKKKQLIDISNMPGRDR
jgi:hypothetical protein